MDYNETTRDKDGNDWKYNQLKVKGVFCPPTGIFEGMDTTSINQHSVSSIEQPHRSEGGNRNLWDLI